MKRQHQRKTVLLAATACAAALALPARRRRLRFVGARSPQSRPIYSQSNDPQQQCWAERVTQTEVMRVDQAPIGVRGRVIEQPGGNDLVAVPREREVQRCGTVDTTRMQLQGYEVRYVYDGREYTTRLPYDPGTRAARQPSNVQPETSLTAIRAAASARRRPREHDPSREEGDAADRRDRAERAHAGQRERVEAAGEQHDAGDEQPAGEREAGALGRSAA